MARQPVASMYCTIYSLFSVTGREPSSAICSPPEGRQALPSIVNNQTLGLNDGATRPCCCVGCRARRGHVQMPKYLRLREFAHGCMNNDPASDIVHMGSFANRPTNLRRCRPGQAY